MHLGSIYLIVSDFEKSIKFYEKLLQIPVTKRNMDRFAMFKFDGYCLSLNNAYFDVNHPDKVIHKGEQSKLFDDLVNIAQSPNTHKFVLNFWDEDLRKEYNRVKELDITNSITKIKYVCNVSPYYYFQLTDPDENIIEVNGAYMPKEGEFE